MRSIILLLILSASGWKSGDGPSSVISSSNEILEGVKGGKTPNLGSSRSEQENKSRELNSISDLEQAGRQESSKNQELTSNLFFDIDKPEARTKLSEAGLIARATEEVLNNLSGALKKHGFNCSQIPGARDLAGEYTLHIENRSEPHTADEPFFCESLKNQYDCYEDLEIHCLQFSSKPEDMKITSTNFKYTVKDELMTMRHDYDPQQTSYRETTRGFFRVDSLFGVKKQKTHDICEAELKMTFDVRLDPQVFAEFALLNLYFTDLVLVTLNGHVVYSSPYGATELRFTGGYDKVLMRTSSSFMGLKTIKYYEDFPVVSLGGRTIRVGLDNSRNSGINSIDLRPHLRMYNNELVIKGVSINKGYVQAQMRSYERLCLKWSLDKWNETCTLKN
jgi:hypothetical protein